MSLNLMDRMNIKRIAYFNQNIMKSNLVPLYFLYNFKILINFCTLIKIARIEKMIIYNIDKKFHQINMKITTLLKFINKMNK